MPTLHYDLQIVKEMSESLNDYKDLQASVLLLGGTKSPAYLSAALDGLDARYHESSATLPGLGHDGPEDDGKPDLVAQHLHRFFG